MNAAEHVARLWLESQGFFVIGPLSVGSNEIDILAVKLDAGARSVEKRVHVELTVSGRPGGPDKGLELSSYAQRKFAGRDDNVGRKARELLGDDYERWIIVGKLVGGKEDEWAQCATSNNVKVIPFRVVVSEYIDSNKTAPRDEIGRLLDTLRMLDLLKT